MKHPSETYDTQETESIIYLPNKVPKNYEQSLNSGGDCGACVIAGLLGISIEQAYEYHKSGTYHGGEPIPKIHSFCRSSMRDTLDNLQPKNHGLIEHVVKHAPIFPLAAHKELGMPFGLMGNLQFGAWTDYVRAMLSGGYYGIAQVYNNGHNENSLNEHGMTNHWVMIKGWRMQWYRDPKDKTSTSGGMAIEEICISNSSRNSEHEQWIYVGDFLGLWGGFDAYWAKPKS